MRIQSMMATLLLLVSSGARAQVNNGGFDSGGSGWSIIAPPGWVVSFPASGGNPNGYARIETPASHSGGVAYIEQTFGCGPEDRTSAGCVFDFDIRCNLLGGNPNSCRVSHQLINDYDGSSGTATYYPLMEQWRDIAHSQTACGTYTVRLGLEVDGGNNHFALGIDNVRAAITCDLVGVDDRLWGSVKRLYR